MDKLLAIFWISLLLSFSISSHAQITGNGTETDPYRGTISDIEVEWRGEIIYAEDLTIEEEGSLTISPGVYEASFLDMTGSTLTINSGGTFIINPNSSVTVRTIINNGMIILESGPGEPGVASLIHDFYSGNDSIVIKLYLRGGTTGGNADVPIWHYISMPFREKIEAASFSTLDLAQYVEQESTGFDNYSGWVAYDGYVYSTGLINGPTFDSLQLGKGYNYYSNNSSVFTLNGIINDSTVISNLSWSGSSDHQGFNLIGNPFSSSLDWQQLINIGYTTNITNSIYFTNKDRVAAYVGGVDVNGGTRFIPPLQGFFVKSTAEGSRVIFSPEARTHHPDQLRYKKKSVDIDQNRADSISLVRMVLSNSENSIETVIRFNKNASDNFDKELDAYLLGKTSGEMNVWSTIDNREYSINGIPFPNDSREIPLGIYIKAAGYFRLYTKEIKKLEGYNISLKDRYTNEITDLKKGGYLEFISDAGMFYDRFTLIITKSATLVPDISQETIKFRIYPVENKTIRLQLLQSENAIKGSVRVIDLTGHIVYEENNVEWGATGESKLMKLHNAFPGLYFVEIKTRNNRFIEKIVLR